MKEQAIANFGMVMTYIIMILYFLQFVVGMVKLVRPVIVSGFIGMIGSIMYMIYVQKGVNLSIDYWWVFATRWFGMQLMFITSIMSLGMAARLQDDMKTKGPAALSMLLAVITFLV